MCIFIKVLLVLLKLDQKRQCYRIVNIDFFSQKKFRKHRIFNFIDNSRNWEFTTFEKYMYYIVSDGFMYNTELIIFSENLIKFVIEPGKNWEIYQ